MSHKAQSLILCPAIPNALDLNKSVGHYSKAQLQELLSTLQKDENGVWYLLADAVWDENDKRLVKIGGYEEKKRFLNMSFSNERDALKAARDLYFLYEVKEKIDAKVNEYEYCKAHGLEVAKIQMELDLGYLEYRAISKEANTALAKYEG